jgi:predicted transcriptional regulator
MKLSLTIRIDPDIENLLVKLAMDEDRSLSELVRRALRSHYGIERRVRRVDRPRRERHG